MRSPGFLLLFFVFGWAYYMVATVLMRGSIFERFRSVIDEKAEAGSRFFALVREMLGCLMCTATEAAPWTLGVATFILGAHYRFSSLTISAILGKATVLPIAAEVFLDFAFAFALSLAVSGEAWVIKTVFEHRERKFLELRDEFRSREIELLHQISVLESTNQNAEYKFDLS